ncbi:MAG: hypothetical protein IKW28_07580, partial [Lachnospiraceae bacterium]|nr:hypothetical protein [Lachnospiraceae bacterium]
MKRKRIIYSELAYFAGIFILALGTAFMEKADFGISMIVAPAYLIYLKVSEYVPFFSFGMAEYVVQAVLLALLSLIMRKFKKIYLLSFVTAFFYGIVLDLAIDLVALFPYAGIGWQVSFYLIGMVTCAMGVVLLLHTYFPPEAYELVVKELSQKFHISFGITKTIYDYCSCTLAVVLSLSFFGIFVGVKWG